jgi:NADH-quinone oxidoreductase subunit E
MQNLSRGQVLKIMERYNNEPQQLIAVLLDIQAASGKNCVEKNWAQLVCETLNVPLSKVYDVLTFYAMFSTEPRGEYIIEICRSTPCFFSRTQEVVKRFEAEAGIKMGETTADGKLSLHYTSCIGACDIGPVAKIGDDVFGNLTAENVKKLVQCCRDGNTEELHALCQN